MAETRQFSTFYLGDLFVGVEVKQVQEVLRYQEMTRVPLAPSVICGLINLRGQVVTALDLRHRLALPARLAEQQPMNVVMRTNDGAVSFLVDAIGDVLEVADDTFEPPPETLTGGARKLIRGVCKLEDRLLLILDIDRALEVTADAP